MSRDLESEQDAFEALVAGYCREAGLTAVQTEIALLHLVWELTPREIRLKLHAKRVSEVQKELATGLAKLEGFLVTIEGFWVPAKRFPHDLIHCAADRHGEDARSPGVSGVTPSWQYLDRYPAARVMLASHPCLIQDGPAAMRLRAQRTRPVLIG